MFRPRSQLAATLFATILLLGSAATADAGEYQLDGVARIGEPRLMVVAPDASLWTLSRYFAYSGDSRFRLHRFDRDGKSKRLIVLPRKKSELMSTAAIAIGPDGNVWVAIARATPAKRTAILRFTPRGDRISTWYRPRAEQIRSMTPGPDGRMWLIGLGRSHFGKLSDRGLMTRVESPVAARSDYFLHGSEGDMWAVRPGAAVRFSDRARRRQIALPRIGDGLTVAARGADGALWFNAAGRLVRMAADFKLTDHPLIHGGLNPPQTEQWINRFRTPMAIFQRPDGRIGFLASYLIQDREGEWSGPISFGSVDESGTVVETAPGFPDLDLYYSEYDDDPTLGEAAIGHQKLLPSPDGKFWVMNQAGEEPGAMRFSLDREFVPTLPQPRFRSVRVRGRSIVAVLDCVGSAGKFCVGSLSAYVDGRRINRLHRFGVAAGDTTTVRLRTKVRADGGRRFRLVSRTFDSVSGERATVAMERSVD